MRSGRRRESLVPMFGKRKLERDGTEAMGRVIESGAALGFVDAQGYHVKARVEFDDGTATEVSCKVHRGLGTFDVGEILPFRYDPGDRSKIVLDEPALKALADETRAKVRAMAAEEAARPIPSGAVPGVSKAKATAIALEKMSQVEGRRSSGALTDAEAEEQLEAIRAEAGKQLG
jgi:hypothetical protein